MLNGVLKLERDCGLFSNLTVLQNMIVNQLHFGSEVKGIELILTEYYRGVDMYPYLFKGIDESIWFAPEEIKYLKANMRIKRFGLIEDKVSLIIFQKIQKKYLSFSDLVESRVAQIRATLPSKYLFLWCRGTDKSTETSIPFAQTIESLISEIRIRRAAEPIVFRTDDKVFETYFSQRFDVINLSTNADSVATHLQMREMEDFDKSLNHLVEILALTKIAAGSACYVATNSNINGFVLQQRGSFDEVYVYKSDAEFLFHPAQ